MNKRIKTLIAICTLGVMVISSSNVMAALDIPTPDTIYDLPGSDYGTETPTGATSTVKEQPSTSTVATSTVRDYSINESDYVSLINKITSKYDNSIDDNHLATFKETIKYLPSKYVNFLAEKGVTFKLIPTGYDYNKLARDGHSLLDGSVIYIEDCYRDNKEIILHESGHAFDMLGNKVPGVDNVLVSLISSFLEAYGDKNEVNGLLFDNTNIENKENKELLDYYSETSMEYFAQGLVPYFYSPNYLKEKAPKLYRFYNNILGGIGLSDNKDTDECEVVPGKIVKRDDATGEFIEVTLPTDKDKYIIKDKDTKDDESKDNKPEDTSDESKILVLGLLGVTSLFLNKKIKKESM